ncbi:hypothetical protein C3K47_01635 [Solitalea longa]|uniref:RCK N-terminal domain-containing protein n=1 Tax=Solitalea longa TaxID=2079460 RepID=A0A2S5AA24_9SPHI|nr:hypothetical protein [Solitalea longa]POY39222.1 hypothetical protein C3K47_01635 [Solitalea longa]
MIVLIGGAEQPGIQIVDCLNKANFNDLVIVHDPKDESSAASLVGKRFSKKIRFKEINRFLLANHLHVQFIVVSAVNDEIQSEEIWNASAKLGIPIIVIAKGHTAFAEMITKEIKQPFYWSILRYTDENVGLVPKMVLHLMEHRKESAVHDLTNLAV